MLIWHKILFLHSSLKGSENPYCISVDQSPMKEESRLRSASEPQDDGCDHQDKVKVDQSQTSEGWSSRGPSYLLRELFH